MKSTPSTSIVLAAAGLLGVAMNHGARAQQIEGGCLRLLGSVACPAFSYAYLSPGNLTNAFPFFSTVTDVASFDAAALAYFSNPYQFLETKFGDGELGCSNASSAVIQYERTVLCSMWVNEQWSIECEALYNSSSAATSQKMVCQSTCLQYSSSEYAIVNSSTYCPGTDPTNGARDTQLVKDFTDCTNWTSLTTNDSATCVLGSANEPNCGFAGSTSQLCDFCSGSAPDECCYGSTTDVSVCGYVLPSASSTSSSSSASATAGQSNNSVHSSKLSGGKLAGVIVGSVIGGLLLLALLVFLLFCCCRRKDDRRNRDSSSSFAVSQRGPNMSSNNNNTGGVLGTLFHHNKSQSTSEKGLMNASSPSMSGVGGTNTPYTSSINALTSASSPDMSSNGNGSGHGYGGMMDSLAVPAGFAGAAAGTRTSAMTLPRVKDENQGGDRWLETGMEVFVLWPYQAALPDELGLRQGMKLRILRLYDDAWGTAEVLSSPDGLDVGREGAFPIVCVSESSSAGNSAPSSALSHSHESS